MIKIYMNPKTFEISNIMKQESPVFIMGVPRSGTTLLYKILQHHSSFKPYSCKDESGVNLIESSVFKTPYIDFPKYPSDHKLIQYMLSNEDFYHQFIESTKWIELYQKLLAGKTILNKISIKLSNNKMREFLCKASLNDVCLRSFFYYAKQARGAKRIIEKTPSHIFKVPEIKTAFPNSKLIFISRHPIDVYSSFKKRKKVSEDLGIDTSKTSWLNLSVSDFCNTYLKYMKLAFRETTSSKKDSFMIVRYEDLITNPTLTLQSICSFLEEKYEEGIIPNGKELEKDWKIDPDLFGTINKSTKNWREYVNEAEAYLIEESLLDSMNQLNYPHYTKSVSLNI
jgi:hypothetical protein